MEATRATLRRYLTTHDTWDYARALNTAIRHGQLKRDDIALCAYLGEPTCKKVFFNNFLANTFYYFSHSLRLDEPLFIIQNLRKWGNRATITATCGVIRYLSGVTYMKGIAPIWFPLLEQIENLAHTYKRRNAFAISNDTSAIGELRKFIEVQRYPSMDVNTLPRRILESLFVSIRWGRPWPGISSLRIANGYMDDEMLVQAMLAGIRPWAMGEYA